MNAKKLCYLLILFSFLTKPSFISAQQKVKADILAYLLATKPQFVNEISKERNPNEIRLRMDFSEASIKNPSTVKSLKGKTITNVELVYTSYKLAKDFSQPKLNKDRLLALKKLMPELFSNPTINWQFTAQTNCKNEDEARKLFHGFIISYKAAPTLSEMSTETKSMMALLENDSLGKIIYSIEERTKIKKKKRVKTGMYYPRSWKKRNEGILYSKRSIWNRTPQTKMLYDTIAYTDSIENFKTSPYAFSYIASMPDSTVFSVLNRNKEWKDIAFVCDVTGSMYPYSTQLLVWNRLHFDEKKAKCFTFFNDGDNKLDHQKFVGRIGGIYSIEAKSIKDIDRTAALAMLKGGGGDAPENNIEATLSSIEKFPDAKEIVMVADNWATIKDISLLSKLKKPVHVIVCGVWNGWINTDYLKLAKTTGGSVHTMEEDLTDLMSLKEGEVIEIGDKVYQISKGEFVPVYDL